MRSTAFPLILIVGLVAAVAFLSTSNTGALSLKPDIQKITVECSSRYLPVCQSCCAGPVLRDGECIITTTTYNSERDINKYLSCVKKTNNEFNAAIAALIE